MNNGKKFDIVLMNPPYDRSLHLKFLEKTIKIADNVISIQPIRWLEETIGKTKKGSAYKKYEESISKHIKDLEIISAEDLKKYFNILTNPVGIYLCDKDGGYDYEHLSNDSIIDKIIDFIKENKCNFEFNKKDGYRVRVPFITNGKAVGSGKRAPRLGSLEIKDIVFKDGKKDGKWWYEYYMKNQHSKTTEEITSSIKFNSEEEAQHFIDSQKTNFVKYVESKLIVDVHIDNTKILWMGNVKNPRTSKIGYKSEWLDKDFNKFFNLTNEEIDKYNEYINKFIEQRKQWFIDNNKEYKPQ